jgi:hypothetical protein
MDKLRIALDYDGTFLADPELWVIFTHIARSRGHNVFILTRRHKSNRPVAEEGFYEVIYCEDKDKIPTMQQKGHAPAHIYIDDSPWELARPI